MSSDNEDEHLLSHASYDHHENHSSRRIHEKVPLYSSPKQRQRWDDTQMLPHCNWGDLYFDLFYVAAAYQLSHAFKDSPTWEGLLYFFAAYLPVCQIWNEKLGYDARYTPDDNLFHRTMEVLHLCILGTTVATIQPAETMKATTTNRTMAVFTGAHFLDSLFLSYLYLDIARNVLGGNEAKTNARLELSKKLCTSVFYGAAFLVALTDYCVWCSAVGEDAEAEQLEEEEEIGGNYWPAYLMLMGFLVEVIHPLVCVFVCIPLSGRSHKEIFVPLNLEYLIHRIGEWIMLMLGESILSILTIQRTAISSTTSYGISFYAGILTVTMFQYLYFRSTPSEGKDHAMRRSQWGGFLYYYFHLCYSASLILVGCSFKMVLSEQEMVRQAEEENVDYDIHERIALVYAISQTAAFLALDLMNMTHRGFRVNFSRFRIRKSPDGADGTTCAVVPSIVSAVSLLFIVLTICLCRVRDLTLLSVYGCILVFGQVMLRTVGLKHFPVTIAQMENAIQPKLYSSINTGTEHPTKEEGHLRRWPNVTEPASVAAHT